MIRHTSKSDNNVKTIRLGIDNDSFIGDCRDVELTPDMPKQSVSIFDTEYKEPPKAKLPTLLQFIKTLPTDAYPLVRRINVMWFPGSYDNYTLETPDFRCQVSTTHPLYPLLDDVGYKIFIGSGSAILINVVDSSGTISLLESNVYGKYSNIGSIGIKFIPTDGAN